MDDNLFATCATNASSTTSVTADELLALMTDLQARFPPTKMLVKVTVGRAALFHLEMECGKRQNGPCAKDWPSEITSVPVVLDSDAHPDFMEMEFADGHTRVWTPFGWQDGRRARETTP